MFAEDWADLSAMNMPFVMERVVVADRGAAARGTSREGKKKHISMGRSFHQF